MAILIVMTVIMVNVGFTVNSFAAQDITITAQAIGVVLQIRSKV